MCAVNALLSNLSLAIGICVVIFALTLLACAIAFRWAWIGARTKFLPAMVLSAFSAGMGWLGTMLFNFRASKTVNGQVQFRFDSRWLFGVSLVLGIAVLLYSVIKLRRKA